MVKECVQSCLRDGAMLLCLAGYALGWLAMRCIRMQRRAEQPGQNPIDSGTACSARWRLATGRGGFVGLGFVEQYSHGNETPVRAVCAVWLKAGGGMIAQETHQAGPDAGNRKQRSHGESFRS